MDPIHIEKLKAMKRYKKVHFYQTLFQYTLTALVISVCFSKVLWYPTTLFSSLKLFFTVFLPNIGAFLFGPKCLFVVCNVIVIFLVSESKLMGPSSTSPDIYNEYVQQNRSLRRQSSIMEKEKERRSEGYVKMTKEVEAVEENGHDGEEGEEENIEEECLRGEEVEEEEEEEEEESGMDGDELKKRVENFIAMVNKQRRYEAQMLAMAKKGKTGTTDEK